MSLSRSESVACCTHGDVLYDVVRTVTASGVQLDGPLDVPVASAWVLEVEDDQVVGGDVRRAPAPLVARSLELDDHPAARGWS